ncbi:unnamed protein product, partial [Mesorhabditis belari]|uniref:Uncharacterized protein n=1 Tax=Mesorhabditis belari TaxID=2138241 RepID=A0AAF3FJW5_9BILA
MSDNPLTMAAVNKLLHSTTAFRVCRRPGARKQKLETHLNQSFLARCSEWARENADPTIVAVKKERWKPKTKVKIEKVEDEKRESLPLAERTRSAARRRALDQVVSMEILPKEEKHCVTSLLSTFPSLKRVHFDEETEHMDDAKQKRIESTTSLRSPPLIKVEELSSEESVKEVVPKPKPPSKIRPPSLSTELLERMRERQRGVVQPQPTSVAPNQQAASHPQRLQFAPEVSLKLARLSISTPSFSGQMIAPPRPIERRPSWAGRPSLLGNFAEPLLEDRELKFNEDQSDVIKQAPVNDRRSSFINLRALSPIDSLSDQSSSMTANTHSTDLQPSSVTLQSQPHPDSDYYEDDMSRFNGVRESLPPEMKRMVEEGLRDLPRHLTVRRTLENRASVLPKNHRQSNSQYMPSTDNNYVSLKKITKITLLEILLLIAVGRRMTSSRSDFSAIKEYAEQQREIGSCIPQMRETLKQSILSGTGVGAPFGLYVAYAQGHRRFGPYLFKTFATMTVTVTTFTVFGIMLGTYNCLRIRD